MRDRRDLGAALLKPAREKILEALRKERQARKMERKLRRQAEGEVKALQRKIDSLEAKVGSLVLEAERRRGPLGFVNPIRPRL